MARKRTPRVSRQEEILGILMVTLGLLIFISLLTFNPAEGPKTATVGQIDNQLGLAGVYISYYLIHYTIGYPALVFPVIIVLFGWNLFRAHELLRAFQWCVYLLIFAVYTSITLAIPEVTSAGSTQPTFLLPGQVGGNIASLLFNYLGTSGSVVLLLSLIMITVISATSFSLSGLLTDMGLALASASRAIQNKVQGWRNRRRDRVRELRKRRKISADWKTESVTQVQPEPTRIEVQDLPSSEQLEIALEIESADQEGSSSTAPQVREVIGITTNNYVQPATDILDPLEPLSDEISKEELFAKAQILEDRLLEFGVQSKVVDIKPGPVITRYEVEPAPGVKISRISGLADDLALGMRAKRIRIVAPIPGKAAVGIEIPNRAHARVSFKEVLDSERFRRSESPLTIALGKTISGEPYVTQLDQMPHLLIAGATGSGKSVCLNCIIASILFKAHPKEVQLVMIDPKRLELSIYNNLRHHHLTYREDLNEEVVTTPANAISVLKSMEAVMEKRYEILARAGVRNISDYNNKLKLGQLQTLENEDPYEPLEYLVLIVDELADLMLTAAREVEEPIARLTQMSRAVGIHLIVATQRPSVDVITGVIKANFPARLAFQVASKTDSRTILDLNGAEKLLGMGDMLFIPAGSPEPIRLHGAYMSGEETERLIAHIRQQPRYPKRTLPVQKEESVGTFEDGGNGFSNDQLFHEAAKLVVRHQQGSISLLQRRLKVGYARAARLIDELEAAGVVGPFDGSKARDVLIEDETLLEEMDIF